MSNLRMASVVVALAAIGSACGADDGDPAAEVCRAVDRQILIDERLVRDQPSSPFVVTNEDDVWVGLIADADVSSSALFSRVVGLFVVDRGGPVDYTRDETGAVLTDARYLDFDEQGQFLRFDVEPGEYQLWSIKSPEVQVVRCPPAAS